MARKNGRNGKNEPSRHHIIPGTRGGGDEKENIKMLPKKFHNNWHDVFGNLTPLESMEFIKVVFLDKIMGTDDKRKRVKKLWRYEELYNLQLSIQKRTIREKSKSRKK